MKKSTYSLILMNDVISKVDTLAHSKGQNRSSFINSILAQYLNIDTPEMRLADIFDEMSERLYENPKFKIDMSPSGSLITIAGRIKYLYNPLIKYNIELSAKEKLSGELRISIRTISESLLDQTDSFFSLWSKIEKDLLNFSEFSKSSGGKVSREIRLEKFDNKENKKVGRLIAQYVELIDGSLRLFLEGKGEKEISDIYKNYIKKSGDSI